MLSQQSLSEFGVSAKSRDLSDSDHILKATVFIISAIMLLSPFGLSIVSESAVPIALLAFYPLTIFACMAWKKKDSSISKRLINKVISIIAIFAVYKIAALTSVHSSGLIPLYLALALPALLASLVLFTTAKSSSSKTN